MLLKKDKPYLDKLQIIKLIETYFNGALKILLSHRLMRHADTLDANITQTHGGWATRPKHRQCHDHQPTLHQHHMT